MQGTRCQIFRILLTLLIVTAAYAADNPWEKPLPFKSATIQYEISGMQNGKETLYIDDFGKKQARYEKSSGKVMFQTIQTDEIEITTEDWVYHMNLMEKTGTKTTNPTKFFIEEYNKLSNKEKQTVNKNAEELGTNMVQGMQGSIEKNAATLLGYKCDRTSVMGTTIYSMHDTGIPLQTESNMMGMSSKIVAVSVDNGSVPKTVFQLPKDIAITYDSEADAMMRQMAYNMITTLKDPEATKKMHSSDQSRSRQTSAPASPQHSENTGQNDDASMQKSMEALKGLFGN